MYCLFLLISEANDGISALQTATTKDYPKLVKYLLNVDGIDPEWSDKEGFTAFDNAIAYGNYNIALIFKKRVRDQSSPNFEGVPAEGG